MNKGWGNIKKEHVIKAIKEFENSFVKYPKARNTFLLFNGKTYPAKHIRWLAYKIANKREISKEEFAGGLETVNFFIKLGFKVKYKGDVITASSNERTDKKIETEETINKKITRLVITENYYDDENLLNELLFLRGIIAVAEVLEIVHGKTDYLITPGGSIIFKFPKNLFYKKFDINLVSQIDIKKIVKTAENCITETFENLINKTTYETIKKTINYITFGIDGYNFYQQAIELVAIFDVKQKKVIHWTGKFYPTESQKNNLIVYPDLDTHFIKLNNEKVMVLGCHDLKVFDNRAYTNAKEGGWKKTIATEFRKKAKNFAPEVVLHHPHTTDTYRIWNSSWATLEKILPSVKHYASAINYTNPSGEIRGELEDVLKKTSKSDIFDFVLPQEEINILKNDLSEAWKDIKNSFGGLC